MLVSSPCILLQNISLRIPRVEVYSWRGNQIAKHINSLMDHCHHLSCQAIIFPQNSIVETGFVQEQQHLLNIAMIGSKVQGSQATKMTSFQIHLLQQESHS